MIIATHKEEEDITIHLKTINPPSNHNNPINNQTGRVPEDTTITGAAASTMKWGRILFVCTLAE